MSPRRPVIARIPSSVVCLVLAIRCGGLLAHAQERGDASGTATPPRTMEQGQWRVSYDERGVTAVATANDPFNAQIFSRAGRLGIHARYRKGTSAWQTLPSGVLTDVGRLSEIVYASSDAALKATQKFSFDGDALDWSIEFTNTTADELEVGDLAIVLPWTRPAGEDARQVFEQGFTKHQFIEGAASFIYFVRASGVGPYLLVTTKSGTRLEYPGTVGGDLGARGAPAAGVRGRVGAFAAFIHSSAIASEQTKGTWRQPNTSLKLAAAGADGAKVTYGFRLQWAKSYDHLQDLLYHNGLFDIRIIPGMTIPEDLPAKISLHSKAKIESIDPEFPAQTTLTNLGQPQAGYHVYEVKFSRLGENRLTIRHDGGRKTYLEFFCTQPLETLIKKRSAFIAFHQQWRDPSKWYDGLFSVYDMEHKILRSPDDIDGFTGRMQYVLACDDTCLGKAPYVASKNVHFPEPEEIAAVEYYLKHFVWGGLQRTDKDDPYPYGIYGIPNWKVQRDPVAKRSFEINDNRRPDLAEKMRVWRSYDYPHVTMLYFHMY